MLSNRFKIIIIAIILLLSIDIKPQTASDFFDSGSQTYVLKNDTKKAKQIVTEGIQKFPNDPPLIRLSSKIKDQPNKNGQTKDQSKQDKQNNQDQQQKENQGQNKQDEQKKQDQQAAQAQPKQQDMKKEEAARLIQQYSDDANELNKPEKKKATIQAKPEKDW